MSALTQYQQDVTDHIRAAGHVVEWRVVHNYGSAVLHIDGAPCSDLRGDKPEVRRVDDPRAFTSIWRQRRLTGDVKKDVATMLDRHAVYVAAREQEDRRQAREKELEDERRALDLAFDVPGGHVDLRSSGVTISVRLDALTPDMARRLASAIRGVL